LGTVVKEVREAVPDVALKIENRWVHYPGYHEDNVQRDTFKEAEASLYRQEREWKFARRQQALDSISLDLDKLEDTVVPVDAPLGTRHHEAIGHIVAAGGQGGLGNPHFLSPTNRSPKFATRGREGESVTLALELKLLADVGLVGMPNAGKSTLLRALTGGRAKSEVAGYAFTTLNPVVGVVRVAEDGTFEGDLDGGKVHDETWVERQRELEVMGTGWSNALSDQTDSFKRAVESLAETPDAGLERRCRPGHYFDTVESFRFTVADNPGLISRASENVGLGHSFLRSMERSLALVYVVDLSGSSPWDELGVLRDELEKYKPGMSAKARMVIANKADLLGAESQVAVEEAREKLRQLEQFVDTKMAMVGKGGNGETTKRTLEVVPTSAKFSQNMRKVVSMLRTYVEEAREQEGKKRNSS
jgi:GTP-binding protein